MRANIKPILLYTLAAGLLATLTSPIVAVLFVFFLGILMNLYFSK